MSFIDMFLGKKKDSDSTGDSEKNRKLVNLPNQIMDLIKSLSGMMQIFNTGKSVNKKGIGDNINNAKTYLKQVSRYIILLKRTYYNNKLDESKEFNDIISNFVSLKFDFLLKSELGTRNEPQLREIIDILDNLYTKLVPFIKKYVK